MSTNGIELGPALVPLFSHWLSKHGVLHNESSQDREARFATVEMDTIAYLPVASMDPGLDLTPLQSNWLSKHGYWHTASLQDRTAHGSKFASQNERSVALELYCNSYTRHTSTRCHSSRTFLATSLRVGSGLPRRSL